MCENPFGGEPRLPQNIRKLFMWVCQEVVMLQGQWKLYLGLFSKKENTELLSDIASGSFILIEKSLANDIAMSISRLSDPAESIGNGVVI